MQSFSDLFANNRLLAVGIVLAAIAVILAVGIALFRLIFGRRLHMSGGRTRQPRLGVVDAFDLDRQRQLVLIRRDNVEHLLMIGGPNDVLIEAAIVRAPAGIAVRDKDGAFTPSVGIPAPVPQSLAAPATPPALPAAATVPPGGPEAGPSVPVPAPLPPEPRVAALPDIQKPAAAPEPAPVVPPPPTPVAETRLPPATTLPPAGGRPAPSGRPGTGIPPRAPVTPAGRPAAAPPPRTNFSRATPVAPPTPGTTAAPTGRVEPVLGRAPGDTPSPAAPERDLSEPGREGAGNGRTSPARPARPDEIPAVAAPEPTRANLPFPPGQSDNAPAAPPSRLAPRPVPTAGPSRSLPPRPITPPPAPAQGRSPMPSLGSLEEEMAKLLGRPMPPADPGT